MNNRKAVLPQNSFNTVYTDVCHKYYDSGAYKNLLMFALNQYYLLRIQPHDFGNVYPKPKDEHEEYKLGQRTENALFEAVCSLSDNYALSVAVNLFAEWFRGHVSMYLFRCVDPPVFNTIFFELYEMYLMGASLDTIKDMIQPWLRSGHDMKHRPDVFTAFRLTGRCLMTERFSRLLETRAEHAHKIRNASWDDQQHKRMA